MNSAKRRQFLLATGALLAAPIVGAQQAGRVYRIALVSSAPAATLAGPLPTSPGPRAFVQGLNAHGYVEGHNLILDRRSRYGLDAAEIDSMMNALLREKPDVIVVPGTSDAVRAVRATRLVPIVMAASVDPVGAGLAQSLTRPGGNVTGMTTDVGTGAEEKRLELLLELLPKARRIAFIGMKGDWESAWGKAIRGAALKRQMELFFAEGKPDGFGEALVALRQRKPDAFFVALSPTTMPYSVSFGEFTLASRIPSSCGLTEMVEQGCLMAYGQSLADIWAHVVTHVDKILKGAKAGDLPIEQPTKFELVINLKTAKALKLNIPQTVMLRADKVIE